MSHADHLRHIESREKLYRGKRVLITGAGNGIGFAFADYLRAARADVHGIDIKYSDPYVPQQHHVSVTDRIGLALLAELYSNGDPLDLLVLSAGITQRYEHKWPSLEEEVDISLINYIGAVNTYKAFSPFLSHGATVIFMSSDTIRDRDPVKPAYTNSKRLVDWYARTQAEKHQEWRFLSLLPGPVLTDLFKESKDPDQIAEIDERVGILRPDELATTVLDQVVPFTSQYPSGSRVVIYKNRLEKLG